MRGLTLAGMAGVMTPPEAAQCRVLQLRRRRIEQRVSQHERHARRAMAKGSVTDKLRHQGAALDRELEQWRLARDNFIARVAARHERKHA